MRDPMQLRQALTDAQAEAEAYRGTEAYKAFVRMLLAAEEVYKDQLVTVDAGNLPYKQGAIKQLRAINALLTSGSSARNSLLI